MCFINQTERKKEKVFSAGAELKGVSKESDKFQSWCEGGGGGEACIPERGQE